LPASWNEAEARAHEAPPLSPLPRKQRLDRRNVYTRKILRTRFDDVDGYDLRARPIPPPTDLR